LLVLLFLGLLGLGALLERLDDERHSLTQHAEVQKHLAEVGNRLNNLLVSDLQLVRGLVSVINLDPALDQARFEQVVRPLLAGQTHLRNVVAAPGMVIRMAVPLQGNEAAIGVDYRRTPSQAEAAQRARDSGQLVLAGPLKLVQGGTGLIARLPVFVGGAQGQHFWGLVSAVIDQDRLFRSAGVQSPAQPIEVAIRGTDARGADGAVFLGRAAVFEHKPVLFELPLPQGSWQLAAVPRGGWTTHSPSQWQLRAGYGFAALLLLGVFVALARSLAAASVARERAETAQRQVLAILEGAPDATLLLDGDGRIERANTQAERLFGRRREQIEGQPLAELVPAAERGRLSTLGPQGFVAMARAERDNHLEMTGVRADGSLFPLEMSLSLLQLDGADRVAAAIRDVSLRKEVEAELARHRDHLESEVEQRTAQLAAAKEAAESASVAKTQFLANMSHEIRTPLNAITGMAYLIRHDGVSDEQARRLDTLESASRHLLQVINAVLDLSKIESGHFELSQAAVDLHELVDDVQSMLRDAVRAKGLQLTAEIDRPPAPLQGDGTRLQQALLNLAVNAVRFTDRGTVALRVRVEADAGSRCRLRFEVQDTGVGIDAQTLARLFSAFEQADNTSTREHGGTGLGLVITRKLAQLMGGDAGAESTPGVGSRFWFTAWLDKGPVSAGARLPASAPCEAGSARVLLVEDELVNRTIASFMLEDQGHSVDIAEDGEQAVRMAQAGPYDLILMDMQMPRMDGLQATRHIRALAEHAKTPIVAITANAFEQDRKACMAAGMDDFVSKPIVPDVLRDVLARWLRPA